MVAESRPPAPPPPVIPLKPEARAPEPAHIVPLAPTPALPKEEKLAEALQPEERPVPAPAQIAPLRPSPAQVKAQPEPARAMELPKPVPPRVRPTPAPPVQRAEAPPPVPAPKSPPPQPEPQPQQTLAAMVGEGRAYLRILEQGSGPSIEIGWPAAPREREKLYGVLVRCLGMRTGVLDNEGRLYMGEGQRNQPSALNSDLYSGFVRRPEGAIAGDEQSEIARVRAYHQTLTSASPARIFPRRVDAYLIGGLRQAVGEHYLKIKSIRAAYRLSGGRAVVESIVADGRSIEGVIDLSTVGKGCAI